MESVTVPLSKSLKSFVDSAVSSGGFGSAEKYIQALLFVEQKRKAREKIEALLDEGIASGGSTELTEQDWEDIRREVREAYARRRRAIEKVNRLIQEGIDSGEPTPWTKQDLENAKREILERHARRTRKNP